MPERMIQKLNRSLLPQWKICFLSAMLVGFAAHFYKITNWLPNWDMLVFRYDAQNMLKIGRWFLAVVCAPSSFYDLPWLNGLLALVLHAAGAVCICKMLHVRKSVTAALIGAVTVSFPTVTSVMMYNYVADGYALFDGCKTEISRRSRVNYAFHRNLSGLYIRDGYAASAASDR